MTMEQKQNIMYKALISRRGIQHLTNVASEVLDNPIQVFDKGFNVIAISKALETDEIQGLNEYDEADPNLMKQVTIKGDFNKVYASDTPVIGEYSLYEKRFLAARIRNHDAAIGHAVVTESRHCITEEDIQLLPMICQTFSFELVARHEEKYRSSKCGTLLEELISGQIVNDGELQRRLVLAGAVLSDSMCLLLLRPKNYQAGISPWYIMTQLERIFPNGMGLVRNGENVYIVTDFKGRDEMLEQMNSLVFLDMMKIGMSRPFVFLDQVHSAYIQADAAARMDAAGDSTVAMYDDVICRHLLECASRVCSPEVFRHPAIDALEAKDREKGVDYLRDLEMFLLCGRSVTKTAHALHVHKNTVYYRLELIRKIGHIDLSDEKTCFLLQLALSMRDGKD